MQPDTTPSRRRELAVLVPVVLAPSIGTLSSLWFWPGLVGTAIYSVCKSVLYGVPLFIWWPARRGEPGDREYRAAHRARALLAGLGSGVVLAGLILGLWFGYLAGRVDTAALCSKMTEVGVTTPVGFWMLAAWFCIGNSFLEEFVFRWFVDTRLQRLGLGLAVALPLSAGIFTLHHVFVLAAFFEPVFVFQSALGVFVGGLVWSLQHRAHRSVLPGWISHALVDLAIMLVGASILGFPSLL